MTARAEWKEIRDASREMSAAVHRGGVLPIVFVAVQRSWSSRAVTLVHSLDEIDKAFGRHSPEWIASAQLFEGRHADRVCIVNALAVLHDLEALDDLRQVVCALAQLRAGDPLPEAAVERIARVCHQAKHTPP